MDYLTIDDDNVKKPFKLIFRLSSSLPIYALVPIAITIIAFINIVIAVIVLVTHHKRRPRDPSKFQFSIPINFQFFSGARIGRS